MISIIAKREILHNIISLRFALSLLLVLTLMMANAVIFKSKYKTALEDYSAEINDMQNQLREASSPSGIAGEAGQREWNIYKHPNPLIFCTEGGSRDFPNSVRLTVNQVADTEIRTRRNFMLPGFADIDWVYIVGVVFSFVAVLFTFDAISGEREKGTLALILSNSIPRHTLLLGKYLGAIASLLLPFVPGMLLNLLILIITGIPLQGGDWLKLSTIALISLLYISAFVLLGLLVSSFNRNSPISLALLLLIWMLFVSGIPNASPILSRAIYKIPTTTEIQKKMKDAQLEVLDRYTRDNLASIGRSVPYNPALAESTKRWTFMRKEMVEARQNIRSQHFNRSLQQAKLALNVARLAPFVTYRFAVEALADTGWKRHERFIKQAERYQEELAEFIKSEDLKDKNSLRLHAYLEGAYLSSRKIAPDSIPIFSEKPIPFRQVLANAMMDIILLVLFNGVFFIGAHFSLLKSSVK
jgi:ABC-type transport system involved in multi-copper enzyme maturation permease subunit